MISSQQKEIIKNTVEKYNPVYLAVFGSYASNEQNDKSDLDLLIDFKEDLNLLELIGLEQELSEILGIEVDLVTVKSLNKRIKPYVEKDIDKIINEENK